jgi:hypothetical protein
LNKIIRYTKHAAIDKQRWDACITQAPNARIYAVSFYLDAMCPGWEALIYGDYEAVFPLPVRKKWSISYVFFPFLTAQLGLFGKEVNAALLQAFLSAIPRHLKLVDIPLNSGNVFPGNALPLRQNFILPLQSSYETLYAGYRESTKRNIRKAEKGGCKPVPDIPIETVLQLSRMHATDKKGLQDFGRLFRQLASSGAARTYGVTGPGGDIIASCVFLFFKNRAYYILVGNHPNGRTLGASHLLIDSFIKAHAGTDLLLDFEGSDLRNLAFFYSSFGAKEEYYPALQWNRLPWYLKWMKR